MALYKVWWRSVQNYWRDDRSIFTFATSSYYRTSRVCSRKTELQITSFALPYVHNNTKLFTWHCSAVTVTSLKAMIVVLGHIISFSASKLTFCRQNCVIRDENNHTTGMQHAVVLNELYHVAYCLICRIQPSFSVNFSLLGPFHGAIAVPSVTRCRCCRCCGCCRCCCGHRCAGGVRQ